jgi:hypothetical protein
MKDEMLLSNIKVLDLTQFPSGYGSEGKGSEGEEGGSVKEL